MVKKSHRSVLAVRRLRSHKGTGLENISSESDLAVVTVLLCVERRSRKPPLPALAPGLLREAGTSEALRTISERRSEGMERGQPVPRDAEQRCQDLVRERQAAHEENLRGGLGEGSADSAVILKCCHS